MSHSSEISTGERFAFGANWQQFLNTLDDERIAEAEKSLRNMLNVDSLSGLSFLDAGSGSGLFSLAARRLGARVYSFDFDPQSAACTRELRSRFFPDGVDANDVDANDVDANDTDANDTDANGADSNDAAWQIDEASVLDRDFLELLGKFDVVYSWGVLHHTGSMHEALENVTIPMKPGGKLFIAIYNDQGFRSKLWHLVKRIYCSGLFGRLLIKATFLPYFYVRAVAIGVVRHFHPLGYFRNYKQQRGMSVYYDWIDWLGGLPFEVASVEEITQFYQKRDCVVVKTVSTKRLGCNQFVFEKNASKLERNTSVDGS